MDNYDDIKRQKEVSDKLLLKLEYVLSYISLIAFFVLYFTASLVEMAVAARAALFVLGFIILAAGIAYAIKIEQIAGYYECGKCHHKYIPSYKNVFFAMHMGRTRYMKCPECEQKSWQKKVLKK